MKAIKKTVGGKQRTDYSRNVNNQRSSNRSCYCFHSVYTNNRKVNNMNQIKILGIEYKLEEVEQVNKNQRLFGEIDFVNQTIKIEKDLNEDRKKQVLLHEILHGICEQLGIEEINNNETLIQSISSALYQVLKDNKINV